MACFTANAVRLAAVLVITALITRLSACKMKIKERTVGSLNSAFKIEVAQFHWDSQATKSLSLKIYRGALLS